jgi:flagellar basal body rod protein FlgG
LSVLILGVILVRLCYVHGVFSAAPEGAGPAIIQRTHAPGLNTAALPELSAEERARIDEMVRVALRAPTVEARSAGALAVADESTGEIRRTVAAISAAERVCRENLRLADAPGYKAVRAGKGAGAFEIDLTPGGAKATRRQLDVAIEGEGFFTVEFGDGKARGFTRAGCLVTNEDGRLQVRLGADYPLVPAIFIPPGTVDVTIGQDGTVQVTVPGGGAKKSVGRLELTRFANAPALSSRAEGILVPTGECGARTSGAACEGGMGVLRQGFLESANVDALGERVRLKYLENWRVALEEAISVGGRRGVASTN